MVANQAACLKLALPATGHASWHADPQVLTLPWKNLVFGLVGLQPSVFLP